MNEKELNEKAEMCMKISESIFKDLGALPPNLIFFKSDAVINVFFDDMDNTAKKYQIAFTAMITAHYLGNVDAIAINTEAWSLSVSKVQTPDLWAMFNGDEMKILKLIFIIGLMIYLLNHML